MPTKQEAQALIDESVGHLKLTTVGYKGHTPAWEANQTTEWWKGLDPLRRLRASYDEIPVPASSVYLNDLGEFKRPAKDWMIGTNWLSDSPRLMGILKAASSTCLLTVGSYGVAFHVAKSTDPLCTITKTHEWGNAPAGSTFRCPDKALPAKGTDGHMVVLQPDGSIFEMWQAKRTAPTFWECGAASRAIAGGWNYYTAGCRGSSFTLLQGCVTPAEIDAGRIPHVLAMILPSAATRKAMMWPSTDTDGVLADGIPEGARLVLPPNVDLTGLSAVEKIFAKALQEFGAMVVDKTGASDISFVSVAPETWTSYGIDDPWTQVNLSSYPGSNYVYLSKLLSLLPQCRIENQPIKLKG